MPNDSSKKENIINSEKGILALIFIYPDIRTKAVNYLHEDSFSNPIHRHLFRIATNIDRTTDGIKISLTVLENHIKEENLEKTISNVQLVDIFDKLPFKSNYDELLRVVVEASKIRNIKSYLKKSVKALESGSYNDSEDLLMSISNSLNDLYDNHTIREFRSIKEVVEDTQADIFKRMQSSEVDGILTGFRELDELTGGYHPQELIILAARTAVGKTAFAINLAANVSKKHSTAFFSLEMSSESLVKRMISFMGGVECEYIKKPSSIIGNPNESSIRHGIELATEKIEKLNLFIDDSGGLQLTDLMWKVKRLVKTKGLKVVFVDYLQLINTKNSLADNRQNQVAHISRSLKLMAKQHDITVIALSQLSRNIEKRENKRPMMSDIRESGSIEQDADLIAFLHREDYYERYKSKEARLEQQISCRNPNEQIVDLIISKHRNGPTGELILNFTTNTGKFSDVVVSDLGTSDFNRNKGNW